MVYFYRLILSFCCLVLPLVSGATIQKGTLYQAMAGSTKIGAESDSFAGACSNAADYKASMQTAPGCNYGQTYCTYAPLVENGSCYTVATPGGARFSWTISSYQGCPPNSTGSGTTCTCNTGYTEINGACEARNENRDRCASFSISQTLPGGALVQDYRLQGNVADGAQFCMPGAFDSASKGCKVSFSRDTFLDYGGTASVTEGTFSMAGNSSTVDQSCDVGPNTSPPKVPEKEKCPSGYTGTVNGVEVCINKVPDSGADGGRDETETNDGTETTTRRVDRSTNCEGDNCTTTTTTTTTRRNNSTGATTTSTTTETSSTSKPGFCQQNPSSKLCKDGKEDGSSFGGSCAGGFTCEGDAIQCAMAQEQHRRACKMFDDKSAESDLYNANKGKEGNQTGGLPGNESISLQGRIDTSDALGGGSCFGDLNITVWNQAVTLPLSSVCQYLAMLGNILVAVSLLMAARIVTRG